MATESRTRRQWRKRVARWKASGLSAKAFASRIGVNHATLSHWKYRLAREEREASQVDGASAAPTFVEVASTMLVGSDCIEVVVDSGEVVRVPVGFDRETLLGVFEVLASRR
jgi:hypothetical protein